MPQHHNTPPTKDDTADIDAFRAAPPAFLSISAKRKTARK